MNDDSVLVTDPSLLGLLMLLLNVGLPLIVGLISRPSWSAQTKGVLLLLMAFIKTILEAWVSAAVQGVGFHWQTVLYTTAINFAIAVAGYFGLLKGSAIAERAQESLVKDPDYYSRR